MILMIPVFLLVLESVVFACVLHDMGMVRLAVEQSCGQGLTLGEAGGGALAIRQVASAIACSFRRVYSSRSGGGRTCIPG